MVNFLLRLLILNVLLSTIALAQSLDPYYYDIGAPVVKNVFVDYQNGSDNNSGTSRSAAYKTLTAAWNAIPQGSVLSQGVKIQLLPGNYPESSLPNYLESRYGTYSAPVIITAADGANTVTLQGDLNIFDSRYIYLIDLNIVPLPAGDALHCEKCDHFLVRDSHLSGGNRDAQETLKVNQSQYVFIESNDIQGASDNNIDFVSVQYGHIVNNTVHNAEDWCAYTKGGSAYIRIEGNEFFNCGTGGYTAGQGSGFEFMTAPWIHYEAYDIKFVNNIIHDTEGAGMGVNGGYNILMAHNTMYRVGARSHAIEVVFGLRSCDGNTAACAARLTQGGWGVNRTGVEQPIGNRNVSILNNIVFNPAGAASPYQHFAIYGPRQGLAGSNLAGMVKTDENLVIKGNILSNGAASLPLGIEDTTEGCQDSNPTCNQAQLLADNSVNTFVPAFTNPEAGDFRPTANGNIFTAVSAALTSFAGGDLPSMPLAPTGNLVNLLERDRSMISRLGTSLVGAYTTSDSALRPGAPGGGSEPNPQTPVAQTPVKLSKLKVISVKKPGKKMLVTVTVTAGNSPTSVTARIVFKNGSGAKTFRLKLKRSVYSGSVTVKATKASVEITGSKTGASPTVVTKSIKIPK